MAHVGKNPEKGNVEITEVKRINDSDIVEAFKAIARIPEARFAQLRWEDNACPRKRTEDETNAAIEEALEWAKNELELHRGDILDREIAVISAKGSGTASHIAHIQKELVYARFYENIEYLWSAARGYAMAAESIVSYRHDINQKSLKWSKQLLDKARSLCDEHFRRGGHDNEFASVREDIHFSNLKIEDFMKLGQEQISKTNMTVDADVKKYSGTVKNQDKVESIESCEFMGLVSLQCNPVSKYNDAATTLAFGAEEAIGAGSKEWATSLFGRACEAYVKYVEWQRSEGIVPNSSDGISIWADPNLHDTNMTHRTLERVMTKLNEMG